MGPPENGANVLGELIPHAARESTERDGLGKSGFARLFVLAVHVSGGLSKCQDRGVEIDTVTGSNLVAGDGIRSPGLDRAEGASLDARHLHVTRDWIASHSEMMFQSRFGGVFDDA